MARAPPTRRAVSGEPKRAFPSAAGKAHRTPRRVVGARRKMFTRVICSGGAGGLCDQDSKRWLRGAAACGVSCGWGARK